MTQEQELRDYVKQCVENVMDPHSMAFGSDDVRDAVDDIMSYIAADRNALRQQLEKAREECARRAALVPLAYGEGILDVGARGATIDSAGEKYETSDAKACLDDPECHRSEFPDNYDDALNSSRYAMSQEGE